jgi:hypothetical protein
LCKIELQNGCSSLAEFGQQRLRQGFYGRIQEAADAQIDIEELTGNRTFSSYDLTPKTLKSI